MIKKAIILSAGLGTRMGDKTRDLPKVMLELNGKPILEHNLDALKSYGVEEVCINLHYLPEKIKEYFGDGKKWNIKINYNFEPEILGTSGALVAFKDVLNEDFFVIYGDVLGKIDIKKWVEFHEKNRSNATLIVHESSHPEDSDIAQLRKDGRIIKLVHKPGNSDFGNIGSAAWYIVSPQIFEFLPNGKSDFIKDVFPRMMSAGLRLYGYQTGEFLMDVGTPDRFKKAEEILR